jgi:hypothetical protein
MRSIILIIILLPILGCNESFEKAPLSLDQKQFVEFELDGVKYNYSECDSIEAYPSNTVQELSNIDSVNVNYFADFQQAVKISDFSTFYKSITFVFKNIIPNDQEYPCDYTIGYDNLLDYFNKKFYFLDINSIEEVKNNNVVISSDLPYEWSSTGRVTAGLCDCDYNVKDNTNSDFIISKVSLVKHLTFGESILLKGQFEIDLKPDVEGVELKNGKFKILVNENNFVNF